jgi:hypothetical protein
MTIEEALTARLADSRDFAPMLAEHGGWSLRLINVPGLTLRIISDARPQHYKGFQSLRPTIVQADIWAERADTCAACRDRLIAFLVPAAVVGSVRFQRADVTGVRSGTDFDRTADPSSYRDALARASVDFLFLHNA